MAAPHGADVIYTGFNKELAHASTGYDEGGCGNYVLLKRPGTAIETLFCHFSTIDVESGQIVRPGTRLGKIGSTGNASGPHLHHEKHENGRSVRLEKTAIISR